MSCGTNTQHHNQEKKKTEEAATFDRTAELMEVLQRYHVSTNQSTVVLLPPTKCAVCKQSALQVIDTMQNIYILAGDSGDYPMLKPLQRLIVYESEYLQKKGLVKLYPLILRIEKDEVTSFEALTN